MGIGGISRQAQGIGGVSSSGIGGFSSSGIGEFGWVFKFGSELEPFSLQLADMQAAAAFLSTALYKHINPQRFYGKSPEFKSTSDDTHHLNLNFKFVSPICYLLR